MYIFWDFNGTILDDRILCYNILNEMLHKYENKVIGFDEYLDIFTFPIVDYYQKVFNLNKTSFDVLAKDFIHRYQKRSLNIKLNEGVIESFEYFKSKGYHQVVLSASEINNLMEQLNHYQIRHYFKDVLGISNIYAKSKVDIGKDYLSVNQIDKSKAIMIGDTIHDAEVAQEMGIDVILYTGGHQSKERLKAYQTMDHFDQIRKRENEIWQ